MYPHRIRLRGPWEYETPTAVRRVILPCRWDDGELAQLAGRVRLRRRFGYPGRIDANERVWLTFDRSDGQTVIWLNDQSLGRHDGPGSFEFEITALLRVRNELIVAVETATLPSGPWGEVALEIRLAPSR